MTLSLVLGSFLLIGCAGDTSSNNTQENPGASTIVGHLVDSPIRGVSYQCNDGSSGVTDTEGTFRCITLPVDFRIGNSSEGLLLGRVTSLPADGYVYPQDIVGVDRNATTDEQVEKMAVLLQSLDEDRNASNGIVITTAMADRFKNFGEMDFENLNDLNETLHTVAGVTPIDITTAIEQLTGFMNHQDDNNDSDETAGMTAIDSSDLSGMTVVAEYRSGAKVSNIQKVSYVFLSSHDVIVVVDTFDSKRYVARDNNYHESHGNNVAILSPVYDDGIELKVSGVTAFAFGISTENGYDKITVGHSSATIYPVTAILSNSDNGIDETSVHPYGFNSNDGSQSNDSVLYDKQITILNAVLSNGIDPGGNFSNNGYTQYDSNIPLHCTDYGYSDVSMEYDSISGAHVISYGECTEFDYSQSSSLNGSHYVAWYKDKEQ